MSRPRVRALVLAAGRGNRLRPLTDTLPKPLLPVAGHPVAALTLDRLAAAGCEAVALNLHHLGDKVRRRFGDEWKGMPLVYSEERELLGTSGALVPLKEFFAPADLVVVVNGDSLCRWPIRRLVRRHLAARADATLLFSRRADPGAFGGGVGLAGREVVTFRPGAGPSGARLTRRVFAGAHALSPELLARLPDGPSDFVAALWEPLLAAGRRIRALTTNRRWYDLGTPGRYLDGVRRSLRGPIGWFRHSWIAPDVERAADSRVTRSVVEAGCSIGPGSRVARSLLLPGVRVGPDCDLEHSVVAPGVTLPPGTSVHHRLVTAERTGVVVREIDSVVGGKVYSPLDPGAEL